MTNLSSLEPVQVFKYFEDICALPHGSENTDAIAQYCMDFAKEHSLKAVRDKANNIIIYKPATAEYESCAPVILQGHIDMVCQKTPESNIDFTKDGLEIYIDGDFIKAKDTTLGADNGIAVAMILAILESDDIPHPPIEAVFTSDEEIGMIGAKQLDMKLLSAKKMINLDSEDDALTVSCAGGSDFRVKIPITRKSSEGTLVNITFGGLFGGHSGIMINSGRVNADILAGRFLNFMRNECDFALISIDGGNKSNAIANLCKIKLCTKEPTTFKEKAEEYLSVIKTEISSREPDFSAEIEVLGITQAEVLPQKLRDRIIYTLMCVPNGVVEMSADIEGLVETSLNLGILNTEQDVITLHFALRSNKKTALNFLEERLKVFFANTDCHTECFGHYPPWEFNKNSEMQRLFKEVFKERFGTEPKVEAIHAGLECGVFDFAIDGLDCISVGFDIYDAHTVNERLGITSTQNMFGLIKEMLKKCK